MKKKLLALLLALGMAVTLCACGSNNDPSVAVNGESSTMSTPDSSWTSEDPNATIEPDEISTSGENSAPGEDSELSDTPTPTPVLASEEPAKAEGLIVMTVVNETAGTHLITLNCVDLETGSVFEVSKFPFGYIGDNLYSTANKLDASFGEGYYTTRREWFDDDFDRMAANHRDMASGECHAGWLNTDGDFFNVTEALGLEAKSDFDPPTVHCAIGFSEDGYFVYKSLVENESDTHWEFYHVPLDNLTAEAVETGVYLPGDGETYTKSGSGFSDYDSGSGKYLLNTTDNISYLCDAGGENQQTYVPGTNRLSWNGVFSADGLSIAFMSQSKNGGAVDIYTMPLVGGDPIKTPIEFTLASQSEGEKGYYAGGAPCSMLIGWE